MIRKIVKIFFACLPAFLMFVLFASNILAAVMSSNNYTIQSDNLTTSGGSQSTSNYIFRETLGEVSTGPSASASYGMRAGYQEMQETYLTVSCPSDVSMTPSISGISGGVATGTAPFNIITDNAAGFTMGVNSSTAHAMLLNGTDPTQYFDNYTVDGTPTYQWNVSNAAKFGYTVAPGLLGGTVSAFLDNGSNACGSGSYNEDACWNGFTTTVVNVIGTTSRTSNTGEQETINLKVQSDNNVLESGTYQATITTTISVN